MKEKTLKQIMQRYIRLLLELELWTGLLQNGRYLDLLKARIYNLERILNSNLSELTPSEHSKILTLKELL